MKKMMILPAAVLALSLALPQATEAVKIQNGMVSLQQQQTKQKEVKYQEVTVDKVPEAVKKALSSDYPDHKIDKAFKGEDGNFKVAVSKGDMKHTLIYSEKGELIKTEQPTPTTPKE
jgi:hypothetical protein